MDIFHLLEWIATTTQAVGGTYSVAGIVTSYLRNWSRNQKTAQVLEFMQRLGLLNEADVRQAVGNWRAPQGFSEANRQELIVLLINLIRGARFHSTQGTPLSSYLRCERLIEQLIQNIQPKRKAGEAIQNWVLKSFLGMGSFGEVWRAENPLYPNEHVFKFFTQERSRDWLAREANVLRAVKSHLADCPNVIEYLDVAISAEPYPYLVLEYAELGSLEDWILHPEAERIALDLTDLMRGIVRGMSDAHCNNIYHRDLKPANILLMRDPEPIAKVADFGLSSAEGPLDTASSQRSEMILVGTRMYHPPEASDPFLHRRPAQDDVFALGVIWYQVLTNELVRPPYDFADRLKTRGVDSRTLKMLSRCLAHPDHRYPSACELYEELDMDTPPGPGEWSIPEGCIDVAGIAREFLQLRSQ